MFYISRKICFRLVKCFKNYNIVITLKDVNFSTYSYIICNKNMPQYFENLTTIKNR